MSIIEIILIGIGLAMDAFAVAVCKGLSMNKFILKNAIIISLYFAIFQAIMPILGFLLGASLNNFIQKFDHWITFLLLLIIGFNMIKNSFDSEEEIQTEKIDAKTMLLLGIATSIDALAVRSNICFFQNK